MIRINKYVSCFAEVTLTWKKQKQKQYEHSNFAILQQKSIITKVDDNSIDFFWENKQMNIQTNITKQNKTKQNKTKQNKKKNTSF